MKKTYRIEKRHFIFKVCGEIVDIWCNAEHNSKGYTLHAYLCGFGRLFEHTSIEASDVASYKKICLLAAAKLRNSNNCIALVGEIKSKSLF